MALARACRRALAERLLRAPACQQQQQQACRQLYDRSVGIPRSLVALLSQEYDISDEGIQRWLKKKAFESMQASQRYMPDRVKALGHDLAAAHFIIKRKGRVKLHGIDKWFTLDPEERVPLPGREMPGYSVEGIDASNTDILYEGLENIIRLADIKYLSLRNCAYIDDWCVSKLHHLQSLVSLDLSDNDRITERGLLSLHNLPNLRKLNLENVKNLKGRPLPVMMLEELLSPCIITGVDYSTDPTTRDPQAGSHATAS